jgi:condensin-2 complex subunit H2
VAGSAAVFGRKVDFLHSLVFQTLDLITTKKAQKERKQRRAGADGADEDAWHDMLTTGADNEPLLGLDDIAVAADAATLLRDDEELILGPSLLAGTSKLAVMRATRIEAVSSYDAAATSRRAALLLRRANAAASAAAQGADPFGSAFRINSCRVHPSGAVVLDANDATRPFANASRVHLGSVMSQSRHRHMTAADERSMIAMTPGLKSATRAQHAPLEQAPPSPYRADFGDDGGFGGGFGDAAAAAADDDAPKVQRAMLFGGAMSALSDPNRLDDGNGAEALDAIDAEDAQVWTFLDMHDALANEPVKPYRQGVTRQNVDSLLAKARDAHESSTAATIDWPPLPSDVYVDATDAQLSAMLRSVTLSEFAPARQRAMQTVRRVNNSAADADADDDSGDDAPPRDAPMPAAAAGDFDDFGGADGGFGDAFDDAPARAAVRPDVSIADVPEESYEELCRRYVENYMQRAASYTRQTEVSKRVATWTERIEPTLLEQAQRETFDIHQSSKQILLTVGEIDGGAERDVSFAEVCAGQPKWNVARLFVASLQLVNHKNLAVVASDDAPLAFKVLSLAPVADVAETVEQQTTATAAPAAAALAQSQKTTKRKALQRHNGPAESPHRRTAANAKRRSVAARSGQENATET